MFFSTAAVVCALSLFSSTNALALVDRQSDQCGFVCPQTDDNGNAFSTFTEIGDTSFSCTYSGAFDPCAYDSVSAILSIVTIGFMFADATFLQSSGVLVGDNSNGNCPQQATSQCPVLRRRGDYDNDDGGDDNDKPSDWKSAQPPSWSPDPYDPAWPKSPSPTPSWSKPPRSWSKPRPSPSWTPKPQPPKKQPCKYICPQKDLAKNGLTDESIRGPYLFCRYPTVKCDGCGFCKYSTVSLQPWIRSDDRFLTMVQSQKTGLLIEDNDDGHCPKAAPLALPWDRRHD